MTDDEARRLLERMIEPHLDGYAYDNKALRYALRAMEDRVAFVDACNSRDWLTRLCELSIAACKHMRGE
jgi:repressor of nif and glnA expression